jgi:hypothetical protein
MKQTCVYCKNVFTSSRKDKRYCSNSCKQLGYMVRKGQMLRELPEIIPIEAADTSIRQNGNREDQNVKMSSSQNVNPESLEIHEIKRKQLEMDVLIEKLTVIVEETVKKTLAKALQSVKSSIHQNVNPEIQTPEVLNLDVETKESSVKEEDRAPLKIKNVKTSRRKGVKTVVDLFEPPSESSEKHAACLREVKDKECKTTALKKVPSSKIVQYRYERSEFIIDIYERSNERHFAGVFYDMKRAFPEKQSQVYWISVRFRSLLESVLTFSEMNSVEMNSLIHITNALTQLLSSKGYAGLPVTYPFTDNIKLLRNSLKVFCKEHMNDETVQLRLGRELKSELLLIRYELAQVFPKRPFEKLLFTETKLKAF